MSTLDVSFVSQAEFESLAPSQAHACIRIFNPGHEPVDPLEGWGKGICLWFSDSAHGLGVFERLAIALDQWVALAPCADACLAIAQWVDPGWPKRPPMPRDARAILSFAQEARASGMPLIIHCEYGRSRSGAAALGAANLGYTLKSPKPTTPNALLGRLLEQTIKSQIKS